MSKESDYKEGKERFKPKYGERISEEDTKAKIIDPLLYQSGWREEDIKREFYISKGKIIIEGNTGKRGEKRFVDYLLYYKKAFPIAVVEAKSYFKHHAEGISKAKEYAQILDVCFAYSTNGNKVEEFDFSTNKQTTLDKFPTPEELYQRWQNITKEKKYIDISNIPKEKNPFLVPLYDDYQKEPRYYQLIAINKVIEAVLKGRKRILLTLATGTGKTYVASQIVWKLWKSGWVKKVLYLTDRAEVLRDQAYNMFGVFGDARAKVMEGKVPKERDIYFATYQTLYTIYNNRRLYQEYEPNFFDMVIIDECHRSGWNRWYEILEYFKDAIHFGMTATPKREDNIDNYRYFGEPVYEYNIEQGIEDGYLANYLVQRIFTNIDKEGLKLEEAAIQGAEIYIPSETDEVKLRKIYETPQFEKEITLPDRTKRICQKLCELLERYGNMDKTIIYCVDCEHAEEVKKEIQNHFSSLNYSNYAVRIVSEDEEGIRELINFRDSEKQIPVVVTTVDLLTTGVDIPSVKNIIFLRSISSVVLFNQILGRGTRIDESSGKLFFRVIDFTGATRLFDELIRPREIPIIELEGPFNYFYKAQIFDAETGECLSEVRATLILRPHEMIIKNSDNNGIIFFEKLPQNELKLILEKPGYNKKEKKIKPTSDFQQVDTIPLSKEKKPRVKIEVRGIQVYIETEEEILIEAGGKRLTKAEYKEYSKNEILKRKITLKDLREIWVNDENRKSFLKELLDLGISPEVISSVILKRSDIDGFDVLAYIAFDAPIITRDERAQALLEFKREFINSFGKEGREIILDLIEQYRIGGIEELKPEVFKIYKFKKKYGSIKNIIEKLKTKELKQIFNEIKEAVYESSRT